MTQIEIAQALARSNMAKAQQLMKLQYDKKAAYAPIEVRQWVWVYNPKTKKGLSKKLLHMWHSFVGFSWH